MPYVITSDKQQIYYESFGEGVPVMFVHGGGATHSLWDQQVYHLADRYNTITIDLRGAGKSDKPPSGYGIDRLADDLAEIASSLELKHLTVVGHGVGNHVILRSARRHPQFVERIALCAAAPWYAGDHGNGEGNQGGFSKKFSHNLSHGVAYNNAEMQWEIGSKWLFMAPPSEAIRIAVLNMALASWSPYVWKLIERDLKSLDHRDYLPSIKQKTRILHGAHDVKNRYGGAQVLKEHLANASIVSFSKSAHCPMLEEVDKFNDCIDQLVST